MRRVDEICAEMVVRNSGWAKMRYAAILLHAIPGVTIQTSLWDSLRTPARQNRTDEGQGQAYTACYRATLRGQEAAVLVQYPPVRDELFPGAEPPDGTHWAGNEELVALGRALGGTFQSKKRERRRSRRNGGDMGKHLSG